jgi:hypothetical protein
LWQKDTIMRRDRLSACHNSLLKFSPIMLFDFRPFQLAV